MILSSKLGIRYLMRHTFEFLITILVILSLYTGCQLVDDSQESSTIPPTNGKNEEVTVIVTVGGKNWEIDPNFSYKAIGVWTNPKPRPLTNKEKVRLEIVQTEIQKFETQLEHLREELEFLKRIDKPHIKTRYSFGKPRHLSPEKIIDLGEFPMEIENYTPMPNAPKE